MIQREEIIGDCRLILGDCLEVLPTLGPVDAVVTDPPYGVNGALNSKTSIRGQRKNDYASFTDSTEYVRDVAAAAVVACIATFGRVVVTPGNRCLTLYPEPDSFGAIYQPASVGLQAWGRADAQPILYYGRSPYAGKQLPSVRCSHVLTESAEKNGHPCPKPIGLIKAIVAAATLPGETVLDPFMGSGTALVACARMGRKGIGIEIEPKYFDIACKRIADAYRQPNLFQEPAPKAVQPSMFDGDAA